MDLIICRYVGTYIQKFGIRRILRLGTGALKHEVGHVTYQSIRNFVEMKITYTWGENISHDHTDFEVQIPFLGSDDFFSPF
jgi:hypothetical protein